MFHGRSFSPTYRAIFHAHLRRSTIAVVMVACLAPAWAAGTREATLTIEAGNPIGKVSPTFYGLMTEGINHSYDGGLYAELVQNRAYLDDSSRPVHWSAVGATGKQAEIALDPKQPLDKAIPTSLRLTVAQASADKPAGIANDGYWGIPVRPSTEYHASFYAKAVPGFTGAVTVSIQSVDGMKVYAAGQVQGLTQDWKQYAITLTTGGNFTATTNARYVLTIDRPGTVWFSLVSLFPPTWENQLNGFRKDIMQMLIDLKPRFLRFPGGNFLEGQTIAERFDWKKTIGPLTERPGHEGPWGYRSTDGMGLLEFLMWCEDMHAQPVLAVYAGYSLNGDYVKPGRDLAPYVQDALDEIEYVSGPDTSRWGAERAKDGHPAPFALKYVEVGNEDWFDRSGSYDARFTQFYEAIKARYPKIQVISTVGNEHPASQRVRSVTPDVLDEHYYRSALEFIADSPTHFDNYDRSGPKIFVGEWASYETSFPPWNPQSAQEPSTPNMLAALGDAAWMTAMERNSDIVIMQCYAPLLVNVNPGARQWRPDLIGYDGLHVFGSPSYYAIQMFSQNVGDEILKITSMNTDIQSSATRDSTTNEIDVKMVNIRPKGARVKIALEGAGRLDRTGTSITLSGNPDATNSLNKPRNVVPVTTTVRNVKASFYYDVPPHATVVLRLATH